MYLYSRYTSQAWKLEQERLKEEEEKVKTERAPKGRQPTQEEMTMDGRKGKASPGGERSSSSARTPVSPAAPPVDDSEEPFTVSSQLWISGAADEGLIPVCVA